MRDNVLLSLIARNCGMDQLTVGKCNKIVSLHDPILFELDLSVSSFCLVLQGDMLIIKRNLTRSLGITETISLLETTSPRRKGRYVQK